MKRKREKAAAPPVDPQLEPETAEQPPSDSGFYVMTSRTGAPTDEGLDEEDARRERAAEEMFGSVDPDTEARHW